MNFKLFYSTLFPYPFIAFVSIMCLMEEPSIEIMTVRKLGQSSRTLTNNIFSLAQGFDLKGLSCSKIVQVYFEFTSRGNKV
jgi:hypothetical protein